MSIHTIRRDSNFANFVWQHLLIAVVLLACADSSYAQRIPREFTNADGLPLESVTLENCPLPHRTIWDKVITVPNPWYASMQFWKSPVLFSAASFTRDAIRIDRTLRREGFRNCSVKPEISISDKNRVRAIFRVQTGEYTRVRKYGFNAVSLDASDTVKFRRYASLADNRRFREEELWGSLDSLRTLYQRHGFARATVSSVVDWSADSLWVDIHFICVPGPICKFDSATVTGLKRLEPVDVTSDLIAQPGRDFSSVDVERSQRILYSRSLFRSVDIVADTSVQGSKIPLRIRVVEADRWQTRFGGGWSTDEKITGLGELTDRYLLPGARTLRYSVTGSKRKVSSNVTISQPHPLGPGSEFTVAPFVLRRWEDNWTLNGYGSIQQITFLSGPWWTISLSQKLQSSQEKGAALTQSASQDRYKFDQYVLSGVYDFRNDQFEATQGGVFSPEISVSGVFFPSTFRYFRARAYGNYAVTFDKKLTYAGRFETGSFLPYGKTSALQSEDRFFLGGNGLIRGWERRRLSPRDLAGVPIGGEAYLAGSFEVRGKLFGPLWIAAFFDAGTVWQKYQSYGRFPLMTTVGTGLRLRTPIGPLRFDIGWKTRRNPYGESMEPVPLIALGEAI